MGKCLQCTHLSQATGNSPYPVTHTRARAILSPTKVYTFFFSEFGGVNCLVLKLVPRSLLTFKFPLDSVDREGNRAFEA